MKKYLILIGVFIGLLAAYLLLNSYNEKQTEEATAASEAATITVMALGDPKTLAVTAGNTRLTFEYDGENWVAKGHEKVALAQSQMVSQVASFQEITANRKLTEDLDEASVYGLAEPSMRFSYTDQEGNVSVLNVGNESTTAGYYYCQVEEDEALYLISSTDLTSWSTALEDYVEVPALPNIQASAITEITRQSGDEKQTLVASEAEEDTTEASTSESSETVDSTEETTASTTGTEEIATSDTEEKDPFAQACDILSYLGLTSCFRADASEADLADLGLAKDSRIQYTYTYQTDTDEERVSQTFYVGSYDSDKAAYYVMLPDDPSVYLMTQTTVEDLAACFTAE